MNVLLLGNGFDLHHKLPTKYDNFLHTVDFLCNNYSNELTKIGDVFGNEELQKQDNFIKNCYYVHKNVYDTIELEEDKIIKIIELTKNNLWFKYLLKSFNKDIGWIDFEKEIAVVVNNFRFFLDNTDVTLKNNGSNVYIINQFKFFYTTLSQNYVGRLGRINPEYIVEYPLHSGEKILDKEKIASKLVEELTDLALALKMYLHCFVENSLLLIKREKDFKRSEIISYIDKVISFNYTNTCEKLYHVNEVFHIHGNVDNDIVLGINPDKYDEKTTLDTSFIDFKKYYQRTKFATDYEYLNWINSVILDKNALNSNDFSLIIMGHSLDITDEDILVKLFRKANDIIIFYHDKIAKNTYIKNIIKMFGKTEFDEIRNTKKLKFLALADIDYTKYIEERKQNYGKNTKYIVGL